MRGDLKKKIILFVCVILVALVFLLPTVFRGEIFQNWISKPISLGLDLSGGVHLVYEVLSEEAVTSRMQSLLSEIRAIFRDKENKIAITRAKVDKNEIQITLLSARSVDRSKELISKEYPRLKFIRMEESEGRPTLTYQFSQQEVEAVEKFAVDQALETLRNRVDQFGVAEPLIQKVGLQRIMLQMPGISDVESVKRVVGSVAKLEFRFLPKAPGASTVKLKNREGAEVEVEDFAAMTGDVVDDARVDIYQGQVEVGLVLNSDGGRAFAKITGENVGRQMAIILDNIVYSHPEIKERISGGRASISGSFSLEEAKQLAVVLRAGALPAPLKILEERTVGPTLGKESIRKGITSIAIGFVMILLFMIGYYRKSGAVAMGTLLLNLFLILAALSAFGATLTLPGLAGLALTIGMAVDSNVIIFERIRDELRIGSGRDAAVSAGFEKALSAIVDSNLTTLLAALVLYFFGSGPIRGFAVTLSIGIATTIYCATFASRLAFDYFPLTSRGRLSI